MIHESSIWKRDLYYCYRQIAISINLKRPTQQSDDETEKAIILGLFIIRKLNDSMKIPPKLLDELISIIEYPNLGQEDIDFLNSHHIERQFDLDNGVTRDESWHFIINQFIHSFTFAFVTGENEKIEGVLINSDLSKKKKLLLVHIKDILTLFLNISEGDMNDISITRIQGINPLDGSFKLGPAKIENSEYYHSENFNLQKIIEDSMHGSIYKRNVDTKNSTLKVSSQDIVDKINQSH